VSEPSVIEGLGVYVHFPWCLAKCPYCDFLSVALPGKEPGKAPTAAEARQLIAHEAYADAVVQEFETRIAHLAKPLPPLRSIFFGGGTPSLWNPSALGRVLRHIKGHASLDVQTPLEVTVECNPTSFDTDLAGSLLEQGVNRVSIGVQNLDNERLRFLGRLHDDTGGVRAVKQAVSAGMPRVSADLIYGIYKQGPTDALRDIDALLETGISHLSAYTLTIEPGTRFGALASQGKLPLLDDELVARSFEVVSAHMQGRGFSHYEVSNFARPGSESVHNMGYWQGRDYLGLGTGAFGTVTVPTGRLRYKNLLSPERYLSAWTGTETVSAPFDTHLSEREEITPEIAHQEALLLGLRTRIGVDLGEVAKLRGGDPWTHARTKTTQQLLDGGKLRQSGRRLSIPQEHWLLADGIIRELI
jgi:putative oxygen-independent coproporphyrinogen III oxidase